MNGDGRLAEIDRLTQGEEPEELQITLIYEIDDPNVPQIEVPCTIDVLAGAYFAIHRGGLTASKLLVYFAWRIGRALYAAGVAEPVRQFEVIWDRIGQLFYADVERWETDTDLTMSFLYFLLSHDIIDRAQAAGYGPALLGERDFVDEAPSGAEVDRWRKRVDRWAEKQGLPPAGKPRRRAPAA
jgi:hypothetical protein